MVRSNTLDVNDMAPTKVVRVVPPGMVVDHSCAQRLAARCNDMTSLPFAATALSSHGLGRYA